MQATEQSKKRGRGRPRKEQKIRNQQPLTVMLPPDLIAALDAEAERQRLASRSEVIRRACQAYLERLEGEEQP
jgi:metal-responsive CopG/Arc/MetJ family transcriptional regulator